MGTPPAKRGYGRRKLDNVYWNMSGDGSKSRRAPGNGSCFGSPVPKLQRLGRRHRRRWAALASGYIPGLLLTSVLIPNRPRHHRRQPRIVVYDPTPRLIRFPTPKKNQQ